MRILIIGSSEQNAIEEYYVKYLSELGVDVHLFPAQSLFYKYYSRSILHKVLFRLGLSSIYGRINKLILDEINSFKPDFVWVFKGMEVYPETLSKISGMGIRLINYNPDNPFIFSGKGSGNDNVANSINYYDIHFTYSFEIKRQLETVTKAKVYILPFGFDISSTIVDSIQEVKEINKVCFLGNPDEERATFIRRLADTGLKIDLYGNNWEKFITHKNIESFPAVYNTEQWEVLCRYRVQLNIMRKHNLNSHNMRSFEITGVGGIMLAPETVEHKSFFEDGREAFFYKNAEECYQIANRLLQLSSEDANVVRMNARNRSLKSGYSYKDRAMFVSQILTQS